MVNDVISQAHIQMPSYLHVLLPLHPQYIAIFSSVYYIDIMSLLHKKCPVLTFMYKFIRR